MPRRRSYTDTWVATLKSKEDRYAEPDPELRGHYLRVPALSSNAPIAFAAVARNPQGKQIWRTVGTADAMGIEQARELAREAIRRIKEGRVASEPGKPTVRAVAEEWLKLHVRGKNLRSEREWRRIVDRHLIPEIGDRPFVDVRRPEIMEILDRIAAEHRPMAEAVAKIFRNIAAWYSDRDENYSSPLPRKRLYLDKGEGRRERILTDGEIRAIWAAPGVYGDFCKLALLTAQRREKLIQLRRDDVVDGVWNIRTEKGEKGNPGRLKLPQVAIDIVYRQPKVSDYVFYGRSTGPTAIFRSGTHKTAFDKLCGVNNWRVHDLRRTARSLMARAGVPDEVAERCLGHAPGTLIKTYNQHHYFAETAVALGKLADTIEQIVNLAA
jgi:integrase